MPATRPDRLYDCCVAPLDVNESGLGRPTRFGPENASVKGYVAGGAVVSDTLDVFEKPTYTKAGAVHETVVTERVVTVIGDVPVWHKVAASCPLADDTEIVPTASKLPAASPRRLTVMDGLVLLRCHDDAYQPAKELLVGVTRMSSETRLGVPESDKVTEKDEPTAMLSLIVGLTQSSGTIANVNVLGETMQVLPPAPLTVIVSVPPVEVAVGLKGTCTVVPVEFAGNVNGAIVRPGVSYVKVTTIAPRRDVVF